MHSKLRKREVDAFFIKCCINRLIDAKINFPIIRTFHPYTDNNIHTAVCQRMQGNERNRPISKSISSHRAKSGLTWTMKIKATNKDASTEQPSSTDICSINCFLVAPLTVRKRHSRTRCRKRSI